ncbi:kinase-like protein [Atractiella rhizophila]|nr:kinase-like protein [Atractiella rhizophila]
MSSSSASYQRRTLHSSTNAGNRLRPLTSHMARQANVGDYRVERHRHGAVEREVIVIEDSPSPTEGGSTGASVGSNAPPPAKRRKGGDESFYPSAIGLPASATNASYTNGVSRLNGVGTTPVGTSTKNKRKLDAYVEDGGEAAYPAIKKQVRNKVVPQPLAVTIPPPVVVQEEPCDDKEGHFIVRQGVELGGRYRISRLLGQGTFGKVVQCYDNRGGPEVAVKVIRAVQKYRDASKVEVKVLKLLKERDPENRNKCIHLLDCFDHRNHICIVTELLSCSVFDFLKDNEYAPFPSSQIQSFAKQLLTSVAFLHDLKLIHTDLKPENILLISSEIRGYGKTRSPSKLGKKILKSTSIRLIDFGSATFDNDYHANVVSTRHYRAPEIILGLGWTFPCDVWSIGCILVEFYTGQALFQTHENLEHLAMMEVVFGRMPQGLARQSAKNRPEFFKGTKLDFPNSSTNRQSRKFVKEQKALGEVVPGTNLANSRFLDLLHKMLTWDPKERISVKDALRHPYFSLRLEDEGSEPYVP